MGRVYAQDVNMANTEAVPYIQLQWNRKYYECGDFVLYMRASDWKSTYAFIIAENRNEIGMVQKIERDESAEGIFVTVSGFFVEKLFDWTETDVITSFITGSRNVAYEAGALLEYFTTDTTSRAGATFKGFDIPGTAIDPPYKSWMAGVSVNEVIEEGTKFGAAIYTILQTLGWSYKLNVASSNSDRITLSGWEIWRGTDRTNEVVFSKNNINVSSLKYTHDDSDVASACFVKASVGSSSDGYTTSAWNTAAAANSMKFWYVKNDDATDATLDYYLECYVTNGVNVMHRTGTVPEIFYSADIGMDAPAPAKIASIKSLMQSAGRLELLNHYPLKDCECEPLQTPYCRYLEHYDLGDKVTIQIDDIGEEFQQRVIEVNEVWENNTETPTLVFGNQRRVNYTGKHR